MLSGDIMALKFSQGARDAILNAGFKPTFDLGVLEVYEGSRPADADASEGAATKLLRITLGSAAYTTGTGVNGLSFETADDGIIEKASAEIWSGVGINGGGTAAWFRFYAKVYDVGADPGTTYCRIDGSVGTSGADLNINSVTVADGATTTVDQFTFTMAET